MAAHIAAGLRLRRWLGADSDPLACAEATVMRRRCWSRSSPKAGVSISGRGMRAALARAAVAADRAGGDLREKDPEAAVDLWQGLV